MTCLLLTRVEIYSCHRLATNLFSECLAEPCIDPSGGISLHVWNESGVNGKRGADARVASPFTNDLEVNSIGRLEKQTYLNWYR
jgi:hypothetical protein